MTSFRYLAGFHLPDGLFDLHDGLVLEAGLQRPAALVVPLQSRLRSGALRLAKVKSKVVNTKEDRKGGSHQILQSPATAVWGHHGNRSRYRSRYIL